jgi:prevent-host-death family protein
MEEIGVRDLKTHASEIMRRVREEQAQYTVTYRGTPIGLLMPFVEVAGPILPTEPDPWEELEQIGEEIGRDWQLNVSSVELISQMRG